MKVENSQPVMYADDGTPQQRGKLASAFAPVAAGFRFLRQKTNLTMWIVVGMIVGILVGKFAPDFAKEIEPMGKVFIRMIGCIVVSQFVLALFCLICLVTVFTTGTRRGG